jgi:hypothetical protein
MSGDAPGPRAVTDEVQVMRDLVGKSHLEFHENGVYPQVGRRKLLTVPELNLRILERLISWQILRCDVDASIDVLDHTT